MISTCSFIETCMSWLPAWYSLYTTCPESFQLLPFPNRNLRDVLAAILRGRPPHAPMQMVWTEQVRVQHIPVVRLLEFAAQSDHLHHLQVNHVPIPFHSPTEMRQSRHADFFPLDKILARSALIQATLWMQKVEQRDNYSALCLHVFTPVRSLFSLCFCCCFFSVPISGTASNACFAEESDEFRND